MRDLLFDDDDDDWDDDADWDEWSGRLLDDEPPPDLGPCCVCGVIGPTVRNIMMLDQRTPTPGSGWGCFVCGLPMDGAVAVLCDACTHSEIKFVCDGYPAEGKRVPVAELSADVFAHDMSKHAEE